MTDKYKILSKNYLKNTQYKDSSKLSARARIYNIYNTNKFDLQHWFFKYFNIPPAAKILELGCGTGSLWRKNSDKIQRGWDIILSDFSKGMISEARQNLSGLNYKFKFKLIHAQSIPFDDNTFDAVIANWMIYHIPDRLKALSEIHRILKPNSSLYAMTNSINHNSEFQNLMIKINPAFLENSPVFNFSLENGRKQLAEYFTGIRVIKPDNAGFLKVTSADDLTAYAQSTDRLSEEQLNKCWEIVNNKIALKGYFKITPRVGLFVAKK